MKSAADRVEAMIAKLDAAWHEFQSSFAGLTDDELVNSAVVENWTVRDLIEHVLVI